MPDPLLVATDGSRAAASALRLSAALARASGSPVEVVCAVESLGDLPTALPHRDELEQAHARGVAERVRDQVREAAGADWPLHVRIGRCAVAIDRLARELGARLTVLTLDCRRPGSGETVLELLHLAHVPVLLARGPAIPTTAVVGIDFRPASLRAAAEAARLVGVGGTVHLAHVRPSLDFPAAAVWGWPRRYDGAAALQLDALAERLGADGVTVVTHRLAGDPVAELRGLQQERGAELLAFGGAGYVSHGRAVPGRVARRLVDGSDCALLMTPIVQGLEAPTDPAVTPARAAADPG